MGRAGVGWRAVVRERHQRERRWFTLVDAAAAVEEADLAALLLRQVPPED